MGIAVITPNDIACKLLADFITSRDKGLNGCRVLGMHAPAIVQLATLEELGRIYRHALTVANKNQPGAWTVEPIWKPPTPPAGASLAVVAQYVRAVITGDEGTQDRILEKWRDDDALTEQAAEFILVEQLHLAALYAIGSMKAALRADPQIHSEWASRAGLAARFEYACAHYRP